MVGLWDCTKPICRATARAVWGWSPVIMIMRIPAAWQRIGVERDLVASRKTAGLLDPGHPLAHLDQRDLGGITQEPGLAGILGGLDVLAQPIFLEGPRKPPSQFGDSCLRGQIVPLAP